jgi:hypothetical protein
MMRDMQIVEQEKRPKNPRAFDDRGAPLDEAFGAVLGEGAHQGKRSPCISEAKDVFNDRHLANADHSGEYKRNADQMKDDFGQGGALAPRDPADLATP